MADRFKNARAALTTGYATVYTVPSGYEAVIIGAQIANVDGSNSVDVSAQWLDSSAANVATELAHLVTVAPKDSASVVAGKLVLETGDAFQVKASAASDAVISLSFLERSV